MEGQPGRFWLWMNVDVDDARFEGVVGVMCSRRVRNWISETFSLFDRRSDWHILLTYVTAIFGENWLRIKNARTLNNRRNKSVVLSGSTMTSFSMKILVWKKQAMSKKWITRASLDLIQL